MLSPFRALRYDASAGDLADLVSAHLKLGRAELIADLGKVATRLAKLAGLAALGVLGYALVVFAGGLALARTIGLVRAFLFMGVLQLAAGALGVVL